MDFTEHLYDKDLLLILKQINISLRQNGKLFIHKPNADYFLEILKEKGIMKQVSGHDGVRNFEQYKKLLTKSGFKNITVKYLNHFLTIFKPLHLFSYLPIIGKYFKARLLIICSK